MLVFKKNLTETTLCLMVSPQSLESGPAVWLLCAPQSSGPFLLSWPSEKKVLHGIDGSPAENAQGQESGDRASGQACLMSPFCPECKLGKRGSMPVSHRLLLSMSLGLYHIRTAHWEYLKNRPGPPLCAGNLLSVHARTHTCTWNGASHQDLG